MTPDDLNNPLIREIQQAHDNLSPAAQDVVQAVPHMLVRNAPTPDVSGTAPLVKPLGPSPAPTKPTPQLIRTPTANESELSRLTAPPITSGPQEHTRANTGTPGVNQIHNPLVRGLGHVGDVLGSMFVPEAMAAIPGTTIHHNMLVREREGLAGSESKRGQEEAQTEEAKARAAGEPSQEELRRAQAREAEARADELRNPKPKNEFDLFRQQFPNGTAEDWANFQDQHRPVTNELEAYFKDPANKGKTVADFLKLKQETATPKEAEMPLTDEEIAAANAQLQRRWAVNHGKEPVPVDLQLKKGVTKSDLANVERMLQGTEGAEATKATRAATEEDRRLNREIASENRQKKEDTGVRQASFKAYQPAVDSAERFNVMAKNYEDAIKNHDQQAMLSLLANHLGMTMGLQKGARLTKDIITEAKESLPWLQKMEAKFDKNGYLSGVTLAPEQMRQMVMLGRERFAEDLVKARNEATYLGATDDGPKRTPNKSTMRFYMGQANGDVTKAKQLAATDGWSVE